MCIICRHMHECIHNYSLIVPVLCFFLEFVVYISLFRICVHDSWVDGKKKKLTILLRNMQMKILMKKITCAGTEMHETTPKKKNVPQMPTHKKQNTCTHRIPTQKEGKKDTQKVKKGRHDGEVNCVHFFSYYYFLFIIK